MLFDKIIGLQTDDNVVFNFYLPDQIANGVKEITAYFNYNNTSVYLQNNTNHIHYEVYNSITTKDITQTLQFEFDPVQSMITAETSSWFQLFTNMFSKVQIYDYFINLPD